MRKLFKKTAVHALFISFLFHLIGMGAFTYVKLANIKARDVEIFLHIPEAIEQPVEIPKVQQAESIVKVEKEIPVVHIPQPESVFESSVVNVDTIQVDSVRNFDRTMFFATSPKIAFRQPIQDVKIDSVDTMTVNVYNPTSGMPAFADAKDSLQFHTSPGPYTERVQRDIDQQNLGHPKLLPLGGAIGEGINYISDLFKKKKNTDKPVRLDFVPSETELDILEILWDNSKSTDQEIYALLDTTVRLTAADLSGIMEKFEKSGLVKRKLVSPRHEFSFPVGKVEMSGKNRRNRVYEYESQIQVADVSRYLQAVLYEMEYGCKSATNDSTRINLIASLKEKILRLVYEPE